MYVSRKRVGKIARKRVGVSEIQKEIITLHYTAVLKIMDYSTDNKVISISTCEGYRTYVCNKVGDCYKNDIYNHICIYIYIISIYPCVVVRLKLPPLTGCLEEVSRKPCMLWRPIAP